MLPFPSKEELQAVIRERSQEANYHFPSGYLNGDNPQLYTDKRGLIHNGGPTGEIVSYTGWTKDQLKDIGEDHFMPIPR
jgi:hypothetical protein